MTTRSGWIDMGVSPAPEPPIPSASGPTKEMDALLDLVLDDWPVPELPEGGAPLATRCQKEHCLRPMTEWYVSYGDEPYRWHVDCWLWSRFDGAIDGIIDINDVEKIYGQGNVERSTDDGSVPTP